MPNGIEELISTLYEMVQDAWSLPLGADKCVLERDKVLDLLDEINNQLPGEFKQAKTIVDARNEVINNAKREAESMLKQAEQKARSMITEEEIYRRAQSEAQKMLDDTKLEADDVVQATQEKLKELRAVTNAYVLDALRQTEDTIATALKDVELAKSRFEDLVTPKDTETEPAQESDAEETSAEEPENN